MMEAKVSMITLTIKICYLKTECKVMAEELRIKDLIEIWV